jgi:two-component system sensor histidine kinase KdpD
MSSPHPDHRLDQRGKPTPDDLLRRLEAEDRYLRRGRLKVFLGYASGVGKTFRMFDEGRRRSTRGEDVVVAAVQPAASAQMDEILSALEVIPPLPCGAIDLDAVARRRPAVCLIDGLAYRNPPESPNPFRWQDVDHLLSLGITVITSINLHYIRERQPQVERIRGKVVSDSVPESFLLQADDIEVIDAPPEYCLDRVKSGLSQETLQQQLSELREIALVLAAEIVDAQLLRYLARHSIEQTYGTHERILVCITPRSNADLMIGRARRQADRFHGALFVAYVEQPHLTPQDQAVLDRNLESAHAAGAQVSVLHGADPVAAILRFAFAQGITQIFVGHSQRTGFWRNLRPNPIDRLIVESQGIDIRIFPQKGPTAPHGSVV